MPKKTKAVKKPAKQSKWRAPKLIDPLTGANKEAHERIMAMTTKEIGQVAVDAGIYTKDGKLTKHYAPTKAKAKKAVKAKKRVPKKPMTTIPEGFQYSEEARQELGKRANKAKAKLAAKMKTDAGLRERVNSVILQKDEEPSISDEQVNAWMAELSKQFVGQIADMVLAEVVKAKRARKR
jgi:hypothetical protein